MMQSPLLCLETEDISFQFSEKETVLRDICLRVPRGSIYGFLGPNGAGKTTTLRLILGLLKKQRGTIRIFNKSFDAHRIEILKDIGSLIESPSLYSHLTAEENLKVWQIVYLCPRERIKEVLEIVGLQGTGNKKAGSFSLGMKQRLSIAIALLPNPSLLILDEPTNGLDPNGIIEIRELLKRMNRERETTILISSHLLAEIEKLVTHLAIIHRGSLLFEGTLSELQKRQACTSVVAFAANNPARVEAILLAHGLRPRVADGQVTVPLIENEMIARLNRQFVSEGIDIYQIRVVKNDLESIFVDLVKG